MPIIMFLRDLELASSTVKIPVERGAAAHLLRGRQRRVAKFALPTRTVTASRNQVALFAQGDSQRQARDQPQPMTAFVCQQLTIKQTDRLGARFL